MSVSSLSVLHLSLVAAFPYLLTAVSFLSVVHLSLVAALQHLSIALLFLSVVYLSFVAAFHPFLTALPSQTVLVFCSFLTPLSFFLKLLKPLLLVHIRLFSAMRNL